MSVPTCLLALCLASASVPSPRTPITPASAPAPHSQVEARQLKRHATRLVISGSAVLVASGLAWGALMGALLVGAHDRRSHDRLVADINAVGRPPDAVERFIIAAYDRYGAHSNRTAIIGATFVAAMTIVGTALLGRGLALKKRQTRLAAFDPAPPWRLHF